jgi:hypothetical protein
MKYIYHKNGEIKVTLLPIHSGEYGEGKNMISKMS